MIDYTRLPTERLVQELCICAEWLAAIDLQIDNMTGAQHRRGDRWVGQLSKGTRAKAALLVAPLRDERERCQARALALAAEISTRPEIIDPPSFSSSGNTF